MSKIWKFIKKKWLWFLFLAIIIFGAITYFNRGAKPVEYVTAKVERGDLIQTVSETGSIKAASEINLNFKGNGAITQINVKEGDEVKAGDVLARLDAGTFEIQVRQAKANLDIANANLSRFLAGASDEDISLSEESLNNAKINYENAKRDHEALLVKLDADIKNSEQNIENSRSNFLTSLESAITVMDHAFDVMKNIVEYPSFGRYFSISKPQVKNDFYSQYDYFYIDVNDAKTDFLKVKISQNESEIDLAYLKIKNVFDKMGSIFDLLFIGLNASVSSFELPQSLLDSFIVSVKMEQNTVNNSIIALNGANQSLIAAKNNLAIALSIKDMQIANSQSGVDSALGAYNLAKAQLDLKKAVPRDVDIAYYRAQVSQARAALDLALNNLNDYIIYAPTAGKVVFVNYNVGEQIGFGLTNITEAAKSVITILSLGDFEIDVDVPESNITKVAIGNSAKITLDAYGDDIKFNGRVIFIDLAQTNIQGVVYYKVKVSLDPTDKEIKPGMTANIDITTATVENVLYLPHRAIKQDDDGKRYVEILTPENIEQSIYVEVGIRADLGTEIKSGLQEGQDIIISKRTK